LVGNQKEFLTGSVFHMALGFHGLDAGEAGQKSIEGFFASRQPEGSREGSVAAGVKRGREDERASGEDVVEEGSSDQTSYRCPRCGKRIAIDPAVLESSTAEFDRSDALNAIKLEHEDFHFAQDLSRGDSMSPEKKKVKGSGIGKGKKKDEAKGIAKYFGSKPK
jgi:DNA polymerase eta